MPGKGYATIGLKPGTYTRLQSITDAFYPGMFLPSTLIMLMNEVKLGRYSIESHRMKIDTAGRYYTMTIRADVKDWLREKYDLHGKEYEARYKTKCFSNFVSYFLVNLFESKLNSQNNVIRLKESDFEWLQREYAVYKKDAKDRREVQTFEKFADSHINKIFEKIRTAKEILTI